MININELNNLENSVRECARDLHDTLPEDGDHLPADLKKCFDPWNKDNTLIERYIKLKTIKEKLFDLSLELCDIRDDMIWSDKT